MDRKKSKGWRSIISEELSQIYNIVNVGMPAYYTARWAENREAFWAQAEDILLPAALGEVSQRLQGLLDFLAGKLADDLEHLSDKNRDRMFVSASSLLEKTYALLSKCLGPEAADAAVSLPPSFSDMVLKQSRSASKPRFAGIQSSAQELATGCSCEPFSPFLVFLPCSQAC